MKEEEEEEDLKIRKYKPVKQFDHLGTLLPWQSFQQPMDGDQPIK